MNVLIKGMDMPKSCAECDICAADFMWYHCPVGKQADGSVLDLENSKDEFIYTESRHPDCPLREIPKSHGRLIDADKFLEWLHEFYPQQTGIMSGIKNARTIIEAEG